MCECRDMLAEDAGPPGGPLPACLVRAQNKQVRKSEEFRNSSNDVATIERERGRQPIVQHDYPHVCVYIYTHICLGFGVPYLNTFFGEYAYPPIQDSIDYVSICHYIFIWIYAYIHILYYFCAGRLRELQRCRLATLIWGWGEGVGIELLRAEAEGVGVGPMVLRAGPMVLRVAGFGKFRDLVGALRPPEPQPLIT